MPVCQFNGLVSLLLLSANGIASLFLYNRVKQPFPGSEKTKLPVNSRRGPVNHFTANMTTPLVEPQGLSLTGIISHYGRQIFQFIKSKTPTTEDAEDILQDVWYQLSRMSCLDEIENTSAWLYAVARRKITDLYRKKKNEHLEDYLFTDEDGSLSLKENLLADAAADPEEILYHSLFMEELQKALDELPANQRLVFVENEWQDKTLQQIADERGENIKTIISRKSYAVKYLRKRLASFYQELLDD